MKGIRDEHIIINLLACRIQRGIDVNESCRTLLQMIRPKLRNLAKIATRGTTIDLDVALADMESQTIEYVQHKHKMGDVGYLLHFLFGMPNGVMRHYANHYAKRAQRYQDIYPLYPNVQDKIDEAWSPEYEDAEPTDETRLAREVIEDGTTLTRTEYRVLRFCLDNAADGAKRPLSGLHLYLAKVMGTNRARVAKVYEDATKKLVRVVRDRL